MNAEYQDYYNKGKRVKFVTYVKLTQPVASALIGTKHPDKDSPYSVVEHIPEPTIDSRAEPLEKPVSCAVNGSSSVVVVDAGRHKIQEVSNYAHECKDLTGVFGMPDLEEWRGKVEKVRMFSIVFGFFRMRGKRS